MPFKEKRKEGPKSAGSSKPVTGHKGTQKDLAHQPQTTVYINQVANGRKEKTIGEREGKEYFRARHGLEKSLVG